MAKGWLTKEAREGLWLWCRQAAKGNMDQDFAEVVAKEALPQVLCRLDELDRGTPEKATKIKRELP